METQLDNNSELLVGTYRFTFDVLAFPETIADIITTFKSSLENLVEVMEGKNIRILDCKQVGDKNQIALEFVLLKNPVPVALIVGAIIGLLGIAGVLLVLNKVEKIGESPIGIGLSLWLLIGAVVFGYSYYKKIKS